MTEENAIPTLAAKKEEYQNLDDGASVTQFTEFGGGFMPKRIRLKYQVGDGPERQYLLQHPDSWTAHSEACLLLEYLSPRSDARRLLEYIGPEPMDWIHHEDVTIPVTVTDGEIQPDFEAIRASVDPEAFPDWEVAERARQQPDAGEKEQTVSEAVVTMRTAAESLQQECPNTAREVDDMADRLAAEFGVGDDSDE